MAEARPGGHELGHGGVDTGRWAIFLAVAVVLAGVLPTMLLDEIADTDRSYAWILTLALML